MTDPIGSLVPLGDVERRTLLDLARRSVGARVAGLPLPATPATPARILIPQGAFVTLRLAGDLRGCIGTLAPLHPLAETVRRCAAAAAAEDPRFEPLQPPDLAGTSIEISALHPSFRVINLSQIILGHHGLMVTRGKRRGVLLPQVATEQGWDLESFLEETCLKAGLPPRDWERGAILEAFAAEVFSEEGD
jgi:uncharacterized protein